MPGLVLAALAALAALFGDLSFPAVTYTISTGGGGGGLSASMQDVGHRHEESHDTLTHGQYMYMEQ